MDNPENKPHTVGDEVLELLARERELQQEIKDFTATRRRELLAIRNKIDAKVAERNQILLNLDFEQ